MDLLHRRWATFCSVPQSDDGVVPDVILRPSRETGVYDEKLHRYVYPDGNEPKAEAAGVVAVAEDRKPTRRESFAPSKPPKRVRRPRDGVDRRTKAYKESDQAGIDAARETDGGKLPVDNGTADAVS